MASHRYRHCLLVALRMPCTLGTRWYRLFHLHVLLLNDLALATASATLLRNFSSLGSYFFLASRTHCSFARDCFS